MLERLTVGESGARYLAHLTAIARRRSTPGDYESYLRARLMPFFGDVSLDNIVRSHVEGLIAEKLADGRAPKSVPTTSAYCTAASSTRPAAASRQTKRWSSTSTAG